MPLIILSMFLGVPFGLLVLNDLIIAARWRRAARKLGWSFHRGSLTSGDQITGQQGALTLFASNETRRATSISLKAPVGNEVSIKLSGFFHSDDRLLTGDAEFDQRMEVHGAPPDLLARLPWRARARLLRCFRHSRLNTWGTISLERGFVRYSARRVIYGARRLQEIAKTLAQIAETLELHAPPERALSERVMDSAEPLSHRVRCFEALTRWLPEGRQALCEAMLAPEQPSLMRLRGALHLGTRAALVPLLELAKAPQEHPKIRADALEHLVRHLAQPELIEETLMELSADAVPTIVALSARGLRRLGSEASLARLIALCASRDDEVLEEVAVALIRRARFASKDQRVQIEDALIALLGRGEEVQRVVIQGLGQMGSVRAVEPLSPLSRGLFGRYKREASDAIKRIQARVAGAGAGQLSMLEAQHKEGALSAPQDGGLSVLQKEEP